MLCIHNSLGEHYNSHKVLCNITMRIVPKVISPILLHRTTTSEVDAGRMAVEGESSHLPYILLPHDEGQDVKMASDVEVKMKQRCVIEFLYAEKMALIDIHNTEY